MKKVVMMILFCILFINGGQLVYANERTDANCNSSCYPNSEYCGSAFVRAGGVAIPSPCYENEKPNKCCSMEFSSCSVSNLDEQQNLLQEVKDATVEAGEVIVGPGDYNAGAGQLVGRLRYIMDKYYALKKECTVSPELTTAYDILFNMTIDIRAESDLKAGETCAVIQDLTDLMQQGYDIFKILIPVALVLLGAGDFGSAMLASDDAAMKKAYGKFIKRLIIGIILFFIPLIIRSILPLVGNYIGTCGIE